MKTYKRFYSLIDRDWLTVDIPRPVRWRWPRLHRNLPMVKWSLRLGPLLIMRWRKNLWL